MTSLFGGAPKVDQSAVADQKAATAAQQKAQRQQNQAIQKDSAEQSVELGTRRRLAAARSSGRNSLFASSGAAGVQETLG